MPQEILHASAVAWEDSGVLILGASGSGKSALALTLMAYGARLVADDRVCVARGPGGLWASAPSRIAGLIEARGIGLLRAEPSAPIRLVCAVDLGLSSAARMPQRGHHDILNVSLPLLCGAGNPHIGAVILQYLKGGPA